jgi:nucleotide-binding universal stress UspA family protein
MGAHGRRGFEHWLMGSVTERVTRHARCPVLVVPPRHTKATFARVLCAIDLTESSAETLDYAAAVARATSAHLVVVHVLDETERTSDGPSGRSEVFDADDEALFCLVELRQFMESAEFPRFGPLTVIHVQACQAIVFIRHCSSFCK